MGRLPTTKHDRQHRFQQYLETHPFITDEELAKGFGVSVQTIRLDRLELGIPEVRERVKQVAKHNFAKVKSLANADLIGELVDLELGKSGLSMLEITAELTFQRTGIARGHFLFAQANTLAVALVDAEIALTGTAKISFKRPVKLGERLVAKAIVKTIRDNRYYIKVTSRVEGEIVFRASFVVFAVNGKEGSLVADRS
ncbi:MAG: transcription factor FapR [Carboxydocellales bacterium]|jgi:acyl-coenzyme A thioesterase PaaI-like protein